MSSLNDISSNSDDVRETAPEEISDEYVPIKKISFIGKVLDVFGIESDFGGAAKSVWDDVIKPTFLDGCRDSMYALADYFFGGSGARSSRSGSSKKEEHTNYSGKFRGSRASKGRSPSSAAYYIPLDDRTEVLDRLSDMKDVVSQCDFCSVSDCLVIFDKKPSDNYTLQNWGWYANDLNGVRAVRNEEGKFYLNLPKPKPKE